MNTKVQDILEELESLSGEKIRTLMEAKADGKAVVGYTGTYIPEEMIRASGAETYYMCRGGEGGHAEKALDYMLRFMNPLARSLIGSVDPGSDTAEQMMDLIVVQQTDTHAGRAAELLEHIGLQVCKVGIPSDWNDPDALGFYIGSLTSMLERVEEITGRKPDCEKAKVYFRKTNTINSLLREINEYRKEDDPCIGFCDVIRLHHYSFMVDADVMIGKLTDLVGDIRNAPGKIGPCVPRLLIAGRGIAAGDYAVPELIERSGAVIVAEMLDECVRTIESDIDTEGDIVRSFAANRYADTLPIAIFQPSLNRRRERILQLIRDYRIDGIVWYQLSFDEIYDMEYRYLSGFLDSIGVRSIRIESSYEYSRESMMALETRIESFIENLKEKKRTGQHVLFE